jgi:hypothetical protein
MQAPLTERQLEILSVYKTALDEGRALPSYGSIAKRLGVSSRATIAKHVAALERKGYLARKGLGGSLNFVVLEAPDVQIEDIPLREPVWFNVPEVLRWQVWERDGFECLNCGSRQCLTIDHIRPWQLGGHKTDPANLQTLCRACNSSKGQQTVDYRKSK